MQFRKDINGLRAVAVIAVVLFHFNPNWVPGGFAGVDVFFVISGFLMTGIIFKGITEGNFSISKFYVARANRIIPPLAAFCLSMLILGYFLLTPWDYKTIGRDVVTSMTFLSNFMFSMRGGYFDSEENFFLHTWSLSAEWQFYLIYPVVLVFLKRFMSLNALKLTILIGTVVGFIVSVIATAKWPEQSYYLLPTRAWEMMFGALAFLYPLNISNDKKRIVECMGLALIILSYFLISSESMWPGYLALLPVVGTWLIIQSHVNDSKITGNFVFQKIGKWSYSIYLWHWPIAVSFSYYSFDEDYKILAILLSIFLGYVSNLLLERRKVKSNSPKISIAKYGLLIVSFGIVGSIIFKYQGFPQRVDLESNPLIHGGTGNDYLIREGTYLLNTSDHYDYLLIGDSNANHYVRGVLAQGTKIKHSWYSMCLSFPNSHSTRVGNYLSWEAKCKDNYKVALGEDTPIILAHSWDKTGSDKLKCTNKMCNLTGDYQVDLYKQIQELIEVYGLDRKIYIVGELPKPKNKSIMKCMKTKHYISDSFSCSSEEKPIHSASLINKVIYDSVLKYQNVYFIDPKPAICHQGICNYVVENKSIFMTDGSHLSGYGSEVIWKYIINEIEK
ncbi:acyltransferase [Pseudoalteromonas luteoviolacea]|uniref:acyltransferase family protein n=1 Tax=Pseudoalteromonas luteoviolacea TaxID=43657 RepID=UPI0031BA8702|nr:acyltransferase [Pseudoalteromonas luteoviolacea]